MIDPLPLQNFQYGGKNSLISSREMLLENNKKKTTINNQLITQGII